VDAHTTPDVTHAIVMARTAFKAVGRSSSELLRLETQFFEGIKQL
jgi:hypothetical protein